MTSQRSKWKGRSLANYKEQHRAKAQAAGTWDQLNAATTLTEARQIVFGKGSK